MVLLWNETPQNLAEIDHYLFSRLRRKWLALEGNKIQTTIKVDTDKIKGFEIPIEANLIWPKLFSNPTVHFPLTAVGNFSIVNLTISNPTTSPIIIQILPLVIYPDSDSLLDILSDELSIPPLINPIELNETLMFSLRDTELFTLRPGSPTPKLREEVEKIIEGPVPRFTLTMLLRPGMSARVRIGFLPSDYSLRSSMMIIRNNLTVIEPIVLYGRGARINMAIDDKSANSQPLLFELEPKHLDDCANPRRQLHRMPTTLTVRRSFAVYNNGEVGFSVVNISISGAPCENRGFRVLNCDKFRLEPNETSYLDISVFILLTFYFLSMKQHFQVFMHMNGTPWSYNLAAVVPKHLLSMCHSALPRPPFEALMYQTCVLALMFCLICMISCAYLEGDRVVLYAYKQQFLQGQQKLVFNLNDTDDQKVAQVEDIGVEVGDFYRREFRKISSDTGIIQKIFWHTLNFVLRVFSYVWPFLRRENNRRENTSTTATIKVSQQLPLVDLIDVVDTTNIKKELQQQNNQQNNQQNSQQQHVLNNKEATIINRIKKKSFVDTTNIEKHQNNNKNNNIVLNVEKRTQHQRKVKTKEKHLLKQQEQQQEEDVFENEKEKQQNNNNQTSNKTSNKTLNGKNSNKENIHVLKNVCDSTREMFLSVSSSSSLGEAVMTSSIINDSVVLFNDNQPPKPFKRNDFQLRNTSTTSEEDGGQQQQNWRKNSSLDDEDNKSNNNRRNDVLNKYSETEETSAEESEIPEWADEEEEEEHEKRDIDEDFEQLAAQSASLFNTSNKNDDDDENKIEKLISKLVKEYRERLLRIYRGRKSLDLGEMLVALPPDLTCNICSGDNKSLSSSNNVASQENNPDNPPRRKSVGGILEEGIKKKTKHQQIIKADFCLI
uniref:Uncharacterized protein n=1 Tax=Meloidogyne enterolobii TaxID=390850 RepID=A0A6V7VP21_MELEN|nr:unnamed protein product [Meloidogyne enterolobii]